jgi:hypothetical protein
MFPNATIVQIDPEHASGLIMCPGLPMLGQCVTHQLLKTIILLLGAIFVFF